MTKGSSTALEEDISRETSGSTERMFHVKHRTRTCEKAAGITAEAVRARREQGRHRQRIRRFTLLASFLLFPITIFYFSPVLVIEGALGGVVVASTLVFASQFLLALVLRRAFCGWACAAGALQELEADAVGKPSRPAWLKYVKYVIWVPWLISIAACAWIAGGFTMVDPLAGIPGGVSMNNPLGLPIYFGIVALFFIPNVFLGRRAMCHCICWMAPFMVLGAKLGAAVRLPQLRIEAVSDGCVICGKCERACPMSLPVEKLLQEGTITITDAECIQCAACADACPKDVLKLRIGRTRRSS